MHVYRNCAQEIMIDASRVERLQHIHKDTSVSHLTRATGTYGGGDIPKINASACILHFLVACSEVKAFLEVEVNMHYQFTEHTIQSFRRRSNLIII